MTPQRRAAATILVPTRNEAENVEPLLGRLSAEVEPDTVVLFVDDSDDDTPHVIQAARERGFGSLDVRLLHRSGAQRPADWRSGACGSRREPRWARRYGRRPPAPSGSGSPTPGCARTAHADLVVASRYMAGGGNEGLGAVRTAVFLGDRRYLRRRCFLTGYEESGTR